VNTSSGAQTALSHLRSAADVGVFRHHQLDPVAAIPRRLAERGVGAAAVLVDERAAAVQPQKPGATPLYSFRISSAADAGATREQARQVRTSDFMRSTRPGFAFGRF
jgi:hypothetical protein